MAAARIAPVATATTAAQSEPEPSVPGHKTTTFQAGQAGGSKPLVMGVVGLAAVVGLLMCVLLMTQIVRRTRAHGRKTQFRVSRLGSAGPKAKHTRILSHDDAFERGLRSTHLSSAVAEEDEPDDDILGDDTESAFASQRDDAAPPLRSATGERAERIAHSACTDDITHGSEVPTTCHNVVENEEVVLLKRVAALLSDQPLSSRGAGGALE